MLNIDKNKSPIVNLYTLCDRVTGRYYPPFDGANHDDAKRKFRQMYSAEKSIISQEPDKWCIVWLGDFDQGDAQVDLLDEPKIVCEATEFINQES